MGLLTKSEEYLNKMKCAPRAMELILSRVSASYKYHELKALTDELDRAQRILDEVRRAVIYFKNVQK